MKLRKILTRLVENKCRKKLLAWKLVLKTKEAYSFANASIDECIIQTLSTVSASLERDYLKKKLAHQAQLKQRVLRKALDYLKEANPARHAFKTWKSEVCPIVQLTDDLQISKEEKEELKQ